jgi:CheY-like chemotaxis protein
MANRKLLLIDDHEDFRKLLADLVSQRGIDVVTSSDGREALERLADSADYGLIMLDLMMPGMDGFAFLAAREKDPALLRIPLVVLTALARKHTHLEGYTVNEVLEKPVPPERLLLVVRRYCV